MQALRSPESADTIAYVRVSTEDQAAEQKTSLTDQRAAVAHLAGRLGRTLGQVFEDAGASGASAEGRRGFTALVAYCRSQARSPRAPGYVLVLNDSRWGRFRDPEEATYWRVELRRHGWIVRFAEGDETEDPIARGVLRSIHATQASLYREAIRANAKRGGRGTAAQGFWQNEAPFGYRREASAPGRAARVLAPGQRKADDEKVRLVPGPAPEVSLVRELFARYAGGAVSIGQLVRELRAGAFGHTRRWAVQSLAKLLRNETYLGHVIWGRRPHDALERELSPVRPASEWVVTRDAHPALIAPALFDAVQARLAVNRRQLRHTVGGYALSGLLTCTCGRPYIGGGGPKGPPADPDRYRFYRCSGQKDSAWACSAPSGILPRRLIEPALVDVVTRIAADPATGQVLAEELDHALAVLGETQADARAALERQREDLEAAHRRLVDAIASGTLSAAEVEPSLARIRREQADVGAALERTRFARRQAEALNGERARLLGLAQDFTGLAARLHGLELRELLRPWIQEAIVDLATREVRLAVRRIPGATSFILSSPQGGPGGQQDKLIVRCAIPLPPARAKRRRA